MGEMSYKDKVCGECRFYDVLEGFCSQKKSWEHATELACSRFRLTDWEREERGLPPLTHSKKAAQRMTPIIPGLDLPKHSKKNKRKRK